jgi:hypothetical protein
MSCFLALLLLFSISLLTTIADEIQDSDYIGRTITRDICVIGGGSGGTFSAIRLAQQGISIIVIEKQAVLGDHTNTYVDPVTQKPTDYGVNAWEDIRTIQNYISYLDIKLQTMNALAPSPFNNSFADFALGTAILNVPAVDPTPALASYLDQFARYPFPMNGYDLSSPIPPDLLILFGEFINKYSLDALVYLIFETT